MRGSLADLLLPPVCIVCRTRIEQHGLICGACFAEIDFIAAPLCERLGVPLPYETGGPNLSASAIANPPAYDRARAAARYLATMRDLIQNFKYRDRHEGLPLFGRWLVKAGQELLTEADVLFPVPLYRPRLWSRRFNQSALLAQESGRLSSGVTVDCFVLKRVRATASQVGADDEQGTQRAGPSGSTSGEQRTKVSVIVVDDVITTGADGGGLRQDLEAGRRGASTCWRWQEPWSDGLHDRTWEMARTLIRTTDLRLSPCRQLLSRKGIEPQEVDVGEIMSFASRRCDAPADGALCLDLHRRMLDRRLSRAVELSAREADVLLAYREARASSHDEGTETFAPPWCSSDRGEGRGDSAAERSNREAAKGRRCLHSNAREHRDHGAGTGAAAIGRFKSRLSAPRCKDCGRSQRAEIWLHIGSRHQAWT